MCGSGTFLIEGAMIAAGINPGVYRRRFAFEAWPDFDADLFDEIYNDDSAERTFEHKIYGCDISPKAVAIAKQNIKSAGVGKYIDIQIKPLSQWNEAPENGMLITNPPYGERISAEDMDGLYAMIGSKLKHVFKGYHAWIIGYREDYFRKIGLSPSTKLPMLNGSLECELREYIIFEGDYKNFRREGGSIRHEKAPKAEHPKKFRRESDDKWRDDARRDGFGGRKAKSEGFRKDDRQKRGGWKSETPRFNDHKRPIETETAPSENPLAGRRNEQALKSLIGKEPELPRTDGPMMRPRRGWKKGGNQNRSDHE